jgi:hypothetical protein
MGAFGLLVAASTAYHAVYATVPKAEVMGVIGFVALAANLTVAALLYRYRQSDSQALSVWLCTRNDVLVNSQSSPPVPGCGPRAPRGPTSPWPPSSPIWDCRQRFGSRGRRSRRCGRRRRSPRRSSSTA